MLVPGDLGFPGLIWFFVLFPIVSLVIRRKWRVAEARRKEIMRLVAMAAEEAERVELEAAVEYGYGYVPVVPQFQCALCFSPTTTRCSRCKAVRYCSGKCQIIHWRRGHKDECVPASSSIQLNGPGDSKREVLEGGNVELIDHDLDMEGGWGVKSSYTAAREPASSESSHVLEFTTVRNDDKVGPLFDAEAAAISPESSSTFVSVTNSADTNEVVNVSVDDIPVSNSTEGLVRDSVDDTACGELETEGNANETKLTGSGSASLKINRRDTSSNSVSYPSKPNKKTPNVSAGVVDMRSTSLSGSNSNVPVAPSVREPYTSPSSFWEGTIDTPESVNNVYKSSTKSSTSESLFPSSFNVSQHVVPDPLSDCSEAKSLTSDVPRGSKFPTSLPEKVVTDGFLVRSSSSKNQRRSASENSNGGDCSQLLVSKGTISSTTGERYASDIKYSKVPSVPIVVARSSEIPNSSLAASNGLKTSVQKVVQQFKGAKISKQYSFGFGSDIDGKQNTKMLFPYEHFVKLYNKDKAELYPCGLTNCGNSCYANAVLQCLAFTRPLTAYLLQGLHSKACIKNDWCFTCEFEILILKAKEGKSPLSPFGILSQLPKIGSHLAHGREEDAHEFLRYAIDKMQSVCLKEVGMTVDPLAEETTLIGLTFGGYLRSKIKCMKCHWKSERHERMMDLTVEIQGDIRTLEEALGQFTATEILDGDNKYHCSRCKSWEKAKKKLTVLEAPNVLTIALKRFQTGKFGKLNKAVRFPEILNLAPYMSGRSDKSPIYSLYAVVVHLDIMNAAFSGHYVCYVKNSQGKWFKIDDSTVKPVDAERVLSKEAYMLLYARCSPRAPGSIRSAMIPSESKVKRTIKYSDAALSHKDSTAAKSKPSSMCPSGGTCTAHRKQEDYSSWLNSDRPTSFETSDSFDKRFHLMQYRIPKVDSSSDNSSLFSCSDEGSCSTESTRDSTSADELLCDYRYGETGHSWTSPFRAWDDSSCSSPSPSYARSSPSAATKNRRESGFPETSGDQEIDRDGVWMRVPQESFSRSEGLGAKGNDPFLYSDTGKHCRKLTNRCSSSVKETLTDGRLGWANSFDAKSGVSLRRSTKERTAQAFY